MNRDELLTMLAGLVEEGRLSQEDAEAILSRFDAGEIPVSALPIPASEINPAITPASELLSAYKVGAQGWVQDEAIREALEQVGEVTGTSILYEAAEEGVFPPTRQPATVDTILQALQSVGGDTKDVVTLRIDPADVEEALRAATNILGDLSEAAARQTAVEITASFEEQARALTRAYKSGRLSLAQWQDEMMALIREDVLAQAQTGAGNRLTPGQIQRLQDTIDEQAAYLQRFAEEVGTLSQTESPMSLARQVDRARQYGGRGYAEFYRQAEQGLRQGVVIDYNAVDDKLTCTPCTEAQGAGPYLPGEGPMPGVVCVAHGKCRCTRTQRFAPDEYEALL